MVTGKKRKSPKPASPAAVDYSRENEAATRERIDARLRQAGWEVDSKELTFASGARPQRGLNRAIAEWPTASGPADYAFFVGFAPLGIAEAKRHIKDVAGRLPQARRYSRGFAAQGNEVFPGGPWDKHKIPFIFATNGRPFLRQLQEKSGIWFQDLRLNTNHPRPLNGWYTPGGLMDLFKADHAAAASALLDTPVDLASLHPYQIEAVEKVEAAIAAGQRTGLVAMATGTGKTRVAIALLYRLIKYGRFRRALFLVDRETLGDQAGNRFKELRLENLQTFAEIYDIKELDDIRPDPNTRLHLATVQGMVMRLLYASPGQPPILVDQYDLIIVDECHRGYILDRELAEKEMLFKNEQDYISKYRRVLDHFDAVKVGLTATPAQHTSEIFGKPIFTYSYRQAVIDGFLIDHEPPIRLVTRLAKHGIKWKKGQPLKMYRSATGTIDLATAPDEIKFAVDKFNDKVITEPFNRVICEELAAEIDPALPGKTLIFCVRDTHADLVVRLLKEALEKRYGPIYGATKYHVCPFCCSEYFDAPGASREDLDHYLASSRYPFAAANLRNLTPMGMKCNERYKLANDILRDDAGNRRRSFDPYADRQLRVSLANSVPFAQADGQTPDWQIDFVPDSPECATWDSVFLIRTRISRDVLNPSFRNWPGDFAAWFVKRKGIGDVSDERITDSLREYAEDAELTGLTAREFLRAPLFQMVEQHCTNGNGRLLELMRDIVTQAVPQPPAAA